METSEQSESRRVTLTKADLATSAGKELVSLLLELGSDGVITDVEIGKLSAWLDSSPAELAAIRHLKAVLEGVLTDGAVSDSERRTLIKQLERVLPPAERNAVIEARQLRARQDVERKREQARETEARKTPPLGTPTIKNSMRGSAAPSPAKVAYLRSLGDEQAALYTAEEADQRLDALVRSNRSITARQWMVIRFWNHPVPENWGKADVIAWLDEFYSEDPDRLTAWEVFKEEMPEIGLGSDASQIKPGTGHSYLKRIKQRAKSPSGCAPAIVILLASLCMFVGGTLLV